MRKCIFGRWKRKEVLADPIRSNQIQLDKIRHYSVFNECAGNKKELLEIKIINSEIKNSI